MPYKEGKKWRATPKYKGERLFQRKFDTKKEAIEWEREQKKKAQTAEKISQGGLDLLTFCSKYTLYSERFSWKTYKEKAALCKQILVKWGSDRLVNEITQDDIQTYLDYQAKTRSGNAANKDRKNLSALWQYGVNILGLKNNPVMVTKKHSHNPTVQETHTEEEILRILTAADREERLILRTFIETAGRRMEVWRLTWNDVNIEKKSIRLWTRKTKDGSMEGEWLPISEELAHEYKWWWDNRPRKESPWVFPNVKTGLPYVDPRKWYFRICNRAGVRRIGFHAFRRYVASILDDKHKQSRKAIQKLLRHKKESTTERYLYQIHSDLKDMVGMAMPKEKVPQDSTPQEKRVNQNDG